VDGGGDSGVGGLGSGGFSVPRRDGSGCQPVPAGGRGHVWGRRELPEQCAFDLAVEEWEKFLKKFPKDPLAAKAQHYLGVCNLQLKHYDQAAAAFQAVISQYPKFDAIQDAYLNLGWCQYSLAGQKAEGMYAKAAATFSEMAKKFPDGKAIDQALFFWGESEYNQGKKKEAIVPYQQLVTNHAGSPLRRDAVYALGVAYEESGQFAEAGKIYDCF